MRRGLTLCVLLAWVVVAAWGSGPPVDISGECASPGIVLASQTSLPERPGGPTTSPNPPPPSNCWLCDFINWLRCAGRSSCVLVSCNTICP